MADNTTQAARDLIAIGRHVSAKLTVGNGTATITNNGVSATIATNSQAVQRGSSILLR